MPLNYNEVQGLYRNEKNTPALQHVGENFYLDLREFLSQLEEEHKDYIGKLVEEIVDRRMNKVLMQAMRTSDTPPLNATPEEMTLYQGIVKVLAGYKKGLAHAQVEEAAEEQDKEETIEQEEKDATERDDGKIKIRIIQPLPAIIGVDSKHYGPFEDGEEVEIPRETAEILISEKIAEEV